MIVRFSLIVYSPLSFSLIPNHPHDMPISDYQKRLLKVVGNDTISIDVHLTAFFKFIDELVAEYKDVVMTRLIQTLKEDTWTWYKSLLNDSINGSDSFKWKSTRKWDYKQDNTFLLKELHVTWKDENESVSSFNNCFINPYNRVSWNECPNEETLLLFYFEALNEPLDFLVGKKDARILEVTFAATLEIERNMVATRKTHPNHFHLFYPEGKPYNWRKKLSLKQWSINKICIYSISPTK